MSTELRIIEIEQKLYELARHATTVAIRQNIGPNSKIMLFTRVVVDSSDYGTDDRNRIN